jgi:hypothetical protein
MTFRINLAATIAALAACVLSLGFASGAVAGNGNSTAAANGNSTVAANGTSTAATGNGSGSTATSGPGNSSQGCDGSHNSDTGNGANHSGPYDNTCDGAPSGNGNGNGQATGKPCAGCVGNADDKNPKGQYPNGSDHNAGYECDRNHGIGRTNPAHTGCTQATVTPPPDCTTNPPPAGCDHGNGDCKTNPPPAGCDHGNSDCTTNPPPAGCSQGTPNSPPAQQTVLGTSQSGTSPGTTPAETPQQRVLGERTASPESVSSPSTTSTTPASVTQARPASATAKGKLPFTGTDVAAVLFAAALALLSGLGIRRLLAHRA